MMKSRIVVFCCAVLAVMLGTSGAFADATADLLRTVGNEYSTPKQHVTAKRIERLIEAGADVNAKDDSGMTALIRIVGRIGWGGDWNKGDKDRMEAVKLLIKYGADINAQDNEGHTALMRAAFHLEQHEVELVKLLIKAGADVNIKDNEGKTALMYVSTLETVKALIKAGADVNAKDNDGKTALIHFATWNEVVKILIKAGADVNAKDNDGKTALMYVSTLESVKALIKAGADVNAKDNNGQTALHEIIQHTGVINYNERTGAEIVKALVKAGANVNLQNNYGATPLMYAAKYYEYYYEGKYFHHEANSEVINVLINAGAKINLKDNFGDTALMYVANSELENPEVLKTIKNLLRAGAKSSINAKENEDGKTALMYAASQGNIEIVKLLINAGANINVKDNYGNTVFDYASNEVIKKVIQNAMKKK